MGPENFERYQDLCKMKHFPSRIGFVPAATDAGEKEIDACFGRVAEKGDEA